VIERFLMNWAVTAVALGVAVWVVSGIHVDGGVIQYLWIALLFGLINATIGVLAKLFTLPLVIVSLGLFLIVINALMLEITAGLVSSFSIDNFGSALGAALIVSIVSLLLDLLFVNRLSNA
jgi:putative membrane protein